MRMRLQTQAKATPTFQPVTAGLLQRKCACGGSAGLDGICEECRETRLQRRSAMGNMPATAPPIVHEVLRSPGQPLDPQTRAFMEPRFGHDFSKVRVHNDAKAAESAQAVNALAYTVGQNVVFGAGQYISSSNADQRLLAHELTHVVQQRFQLSSASNSIAIGPANDAMEKQADRKALSVRGSFDNSPENILNSPKAALQRQITPPPDTQDAKKMEQWAIDINKKEIPGWTTKLPDCPCTLAAAQANTKDWHNPLGRACIPKYHPGSVTGVRSVDSFASIKGTEHGQQCCYDKNGDLISSGPGAGTPDIWSPSLGNLLKHNQFDVVPWDVLGSATYNKYWIPNQGKGCKASKADLPKPPEKE